MKKTNLDSKIKLFIIKTNMKKDLMDSFYNVRKKDMKKNLGDKFVDVDPWSEEDWES